MDLYKRLVRVTVLCFFFFYYWEYDIRRKKKIWTLLKKRFRVIVPCRSSFFFLWERTKSEKKKIWPELYKNKCEGKCFFSIIFFSFFFLFFSNLTHRIVFLECKWRIVKFDTVRQDEARHHSLTLSTITRTSKCK